MEQNTERKLSISGAIVLAGTIIAVAILLTNSKISIVKNDSQGSKNQQQKEIVISQVTEKDHILGNPNANIVIIEFSDTECPFCKQFEPIIMKIITDYKGEVALIYRHFPLDSLHSKARKEAEATECANEQGGNIIFWKYINKIFEITPSNDGLDQKELPKIASELGLDVNKFNFCLSSGKYKELVESNFQDGIKAGVTGTPSSVILNRKTGKKILLVGAESYETIKNAVDSIK